MLVRITGLTELVEVHSRREVEASLSAVYILYDEVELVIASCSVRSEAEAGGNSLRNAHYFGILKDKQSILLRI